MLGGAGHAMHWKAKIRFIFIKKLGQKRNYKNYFLKNRFLVFDRF